MYYFLALFTGVLIAVMITLNGLMSAAHGLFAGTVVIHLVGLALITGMLLARREAFFLRGRGIPLYMYLGGTVGVVTVLLTNFAFARGISVTALLALGLFGQSLSGIAVDQYGIFGMARHPFNRRKLAGLSLMLAGIGVMVTDFGGNAAAVAAAAAFASGASIVTSRVLNARLAAQIGSRRGVFMTHIPGLAVAVLLLAGAIAFGDVPAFHFDYVLSPRFFIYAGGLLGVAVISIDNFTSVRLPAFYLALMLFVGQVGAGLAIDFVIDRVFNPVNMIGGALVALGLCLNVLIDKQAPTAKAP